jgi:chemotaxis protein CheC
MKKIDEKLLRKISEAGTNNASKALSAMTGRSVEIKTISTDFVTIEEIPQFYGPEEVVTAVYLPVTGDAHGCALLVFDKNSAVRVADLLMRHAGITETSIELYRSALKEIGNIMSGSFLNATADVLDIKLVEGIPTLTTDMMGAIMNQIISEFAQTTKQALAIEIGFAIKDVEVTAYLFKLLETSGGGGNKLFSH